MAMKYFENYLANLARTPNEEYRELKQATIDSIWEDTTELFNIEQIDAMCKVQEQIQVWLDTVTDAIVNAEKNADDYRQIYFRDVNYSVIRGTYYQFDDNIWLTYEGSNEIDTSSSCKVRRCNNTLRWVNDIGEVISIPCVIDYNLQSPSQQVTKDITTANGHITVIVQGNEYTHSLKKNQRFIFNGIPYKFIAINNYMQNDYVTKETPLLFFEMYWDTLQNTDNEIDNIADDTRDDYRISLNVNEVDILSNIDNIEIMVINAFKNGEQMELSPRFECYSTDPNIIVMDSDNINEYIIFTEQLAGYESSIHFRIFGNEKTDIEVPLVVKEEIIPTSNIVFKVEPNPERLFLHESVEMVGKLYKDGIEIDDIDVNCVASGIPIDKYTLVKDNENANIWRLSNIAFAIYPKDKLNLLFTTIYEDIEYTDSFVVEFKGYY